MASFDVIVVGAGIIGSSVAMHTSMKGLTVAVVESEAKPAAKATQNTWAWLNANQKTPPAYQQLNIDSMVEWRSERMAGATPLFCGGVLLADSKPSSDPAYPSNRLNLDQLLTLEPALQGSPWVNSQRASPSASSFIRHYPQEGLVDPLRATHHLLSEAQRGGAELHLNTHVRSLVLEDKDKHSQDRDSNDSTISSGVVPSCGTEDARITVRGVETSDGTVLTADTVVLACGVDIPALTSRPPLNINVPLLHRPGVLFHTEPLAPGTLRTVLVAEDCYMMQRPDGRVVIGEVMNGGEGSSAKDGSKGALQKENVEAKARDANTSLERVARVMGKAARVVPALARTRVERVTLGYRPFPADGRPIIGHPEGARGLYIVVTHSGITLAPLLGRLAASEIAAGRACEKVLDPFRLSRDFGKPAGWDIQMDGSQDRKSVNK